MRKPPIATQMIPIISNIQQRYEMPLAKKYNDVKPKADPFVKVIVGLAAVLMMIIFAHWYWYLIHIR